MTDKIIYMEHDLIVDREDGSDTTIDIPNGKVWTLKEYMFSSSGKGRMSIYYSEDGESWSNTFSGKENDTSAFFIIVTDGNSKHERLQNSIFSFTGTSSNKLKIRVKNLELSSHRYDGFIIMDEV